MKTLLVLAEHPDLAEALRAGLNMEQYRVIERSNLDEAEPFLTHGLADACILDVELSEPQGVWSLEKVRRRAPKCPIIIYTGTRQWEWEEEAYLQGARFVLSKPVRARMLNTVLDQLWQSQPAARAVSPTFDVPQAASRLAPPEVRGSLGGMPSLGILRDFSAILTHSLNAEAMLKQFLILLREILSINKAALFLRQPAGGFGERSILSEARKLHCASAIGISPGLLEHFELTMDTGLGGLLFRLGRILRKNSEEARKDLDAQNEFEVLGGQVAVPILDRETLLGVAVFDGRITGEPLVNSELELIFHLLEQLGLAIKNIWLHDQLAANLEMMTGVLRELSSACIVFGGNLGILHANKNARRYFSKNERRSGDLEFSDLPQALGARVHQVLKSGTAVPPFKFEAAPGCFYSITIVPFQRQATGLPVSALLLADDITQAEQVKHLEIEVANSRLVKTAAFALTNEIGNAITPLSSLQQMLPECRKDPKFLVELETVMGSSVDRLSRRGNQLKLLCRENLISREPVLVSALIEEAFRDARKHSFAVSPQLKLELADKNIRLLVDQTAFKQALSEILLNAIQANPDNPIVSVRGYVEINGKSEVCIEVEDNGTGFTPEAAQKASTIFFTTRVAGMGLGLAVSRRILEMHRGKFEILPGAPGKPAIVRLKLPLEPVMS